MAGRSRRPALAPAGPPVLMVTLRARARRPAMAKAGPHPSRGPAGHFGSAGLTPLVRRVIALSLSVVLESARARVQYSDTSA